MVVLVICQAEAEAEGQPVSVLQVLRLAQVMAATLQLKVYHMDSPQEGVVPQAEAITRLVIMQSLVVVEEQGLGTEPMPEMEAVLCMAQAVVEVQSVSPLERLAGQGVLGVTIARGAEQQVVPMATLVPLVMMEPLVAMGAAMAAEEQDAVPHQAITAAMAVMAVRLGEAAVEQGLVRVQALMGQAATVQEGKFGFFRGR